MSNTSLLAVSAVKLPYKQIHHNHSLVAKHSICALQYCSAQVPWALRSGAVAFLLSGDDTLESMKFHVVYGVTRNKCMLSKKTDVQLFVNLIRFPGANLDRIASNSACKSVNVAGACSALSLMMAK